MLEEVAKSWNVFALKIVRQTLAWEATDVTLASVGLPQAWSVEEEAMDAPTLT
jgi:hypothetical protein